MKKLTRLLLLTGLVCVFSSAPAFAANWTIEVNGNKLNTEVKEINNRTLVPLRAVGEALNLDVNYDSANNMVTLETTNDNFSSANIQLNSKTNAYTAKVASFTDHYKQYDLNISSSDSYYMRVAPIEINDRLYVPVRIICDSFGAPVEVKGKTISIGSCFTAEGNAKDKIIELITTKTQSQTTNSSDPIIGKWEIIEIDNIDTEGLGGYIEFKSNGNVRIKLPLDDEILSVKWKFYRETIEDGRTYRSYQVRNSAGSVFITTISHPLGIITIDNINIVFKK